MAPTLDVLVLLIKVSPLPILNNKIKSQSDPIWLTLQTLRPFIIRLTVQCNPIGCFRRSKRAGGSDRGHNLRLPHQAAAAVVSGHDQNDLLRPGHLHSAVHTLFHHPLSLRPRVHVRGETGVAGAQWHPHLGHPVSGQRDAHPLCQLPIQRLLPLFAQMHANGWSPIVSNQHLTN